MSKKQILIVFIVLVVVAAFLYLLVKLENCGCDDEGMETDVAGSGMEIIDDSKHAQEVVQEQNVNNQVIQDVMELQIETVKEGTGEAIAAGQTAVVHYTGFLTDGTKFDSSVDRGTPFEFGLGAGQVIPGWDQGVVGMKVGEQRKLTIPSDLAYGDSGVPGAIPPGATLVFDVELLGIK